MTFPATRFTHRLTIGCGRWFVALVATDQEIGIAALLFGRNAAVPWASQSPLVWTYRSTFFGATS